MKFDHRLNWIAGIFLALGYLQGKGTAGQDVLGDVLFVLLLVGMFYTWDAFTELVAYTIRETYKLFHKEADDATEEG